MRNGYARHYQVHAGQGPRIATVRPAATRCDFCGCVLPPYESVRLEWATVRLCSRCLAWVWWYDYTEAGRCELRGLCVTA